MITKFKIFENNNSKLFVNEKEIKSLLLNDEDFANDDVFQGIINIAYNKYRDNNWSYTQFLEWVKENFGDLPLLCVQFGTYIGQIYNGGFVQYFYNGFASKNSQGVSGDYKDLEKHENLVQLFKELGMTKILPTGQKAYNIMESFELQMTDDVENCGYCGGSGEEDCRECAGDGTFECDECYGSGKNDDEDCDKCGGDGTLFCDECEGKGHFECENCDGAGEVSTEEKPYTKDWDELDKKWVEISNDIIKELNNYIKSLTLDGEKIEIGRAHV